MEKKKPEGILRQNLYIKRKWTIRKKKNNEAVKETLFFWENQGTIE